MFFKLFLAISVLVGFATCYENSLPFMNLGGKLYYFHTATKETWNDALHWCLNHELQLLSIESEYEDTRISRAISDNEMYWTSGNDLEMEGMYIWRTSGPMIPHTNWAPGEPTGIDLQNCVFLGRWDGAKNVNWHDAPCHWKHHFICEEPEPPPTL